MKWREAFFCAVGCYGLSYLAVLSIAARKGFALASFYSLTVWLVSALILFAACGVVPFIAYLFLRFRASWQRRFFAFWSICIVLAGLALFANAA